MNQPQAPLVVPPGTLQSEPAPGPLPPPATPDTAERLQSALDALQRSEERFRRLTELSSDWYWEQDAQGRFLQINGGDATAPGGPAAGYLGNCLWDIPFVHSPEGGWAAHRAALAAGLPFHHLEVRVADRGGRPVWMAISGVPYLAPDGQVLGYRGIGRDISVDKQAALARQEALDRMHKIASRVPGMVFQYRLRLDGSGCYPFASDGIRDLLGLRPEDLREDLAPLVALLHPDDIDRIRATSRTSAQNLSLWQQEYRIVRTDGTLRWLQSNAMPEREADGSTLWSGFVTDITDQKRKQDLLGAALREKSALLQEVHHRVKNNLQVVMSLLRLEARRNTQGAVVSVLDDMQGRIRAMALLHESLYRTDEFASVRLEHYVREIATQAFRAVGFRDDQVRLQLALAPVRIGLHQASPCGLIVNELISNCFKHGFPEGRGGVVTLSLQPVPGGPLVRLAVSDSGAGFPPGFSAQGGPSLGLQLVSDLSRQLGGTLEIGPGSVVTLNFTPELPETPDPVVL